MLHLGQYFAILNLKHSIYCVAGTFSCHRCWCLFIRYRKSFRHDPPRNHVHAMDLCLLLANRGASYLRRLWDGDAYAALIDLLRALKIEPRNPKIHYRIIKALVELRQYDKARKMYELYKV